MWVCSFGHGIMSFHVRQRLKAGLSSYWHPQGFCKPPVVRVLWRGTMTWEARPVQAGVLRRKIDIWKDCLDETCVPGSGDSQSLTKVFRNGSLRKITWLLESSLPVLLCQLSRLIAIYFGKFLNLSCQFFCLQNRDSSVSFKMCWGSQITKVLTN